MSSSLITQNAPFSVIPPEKNDDEETTTSKNNSNNDHHHRSPPDIVIDDDSENDITTSSREEEEDHSKLQRIDKILSDIHIFKNEINKSLHDGYYYSSSSSWSVFFEVSHKHTHYKPQQQRRRRRRIDYDDLSLPKSDSDDDDDDGDRESLALILSNDFLSPISENNQTTQENLRFKRRRRRGGGGGRPHTTGSFITLPKIARQHEVFGSNNNNNQYRPFSAWNENGGGQITSRRPFRERNDQDQPPENDDNPPKPPLFYTLPSTLPDPIRHAFPSPHPPKKAPKPHPFPHTLPPTHPLHLPPTPRTQTLLRSKIHHRRLSAISRRDHLIAIHQSSILESIDKRNRTRTTRRRLKQRHDRQCRLLTLIIAAVTIGGWFREGKAVLERYRLDCLASRIQKRWRRRMFKRAAAEARDTQKKLKTIGWRLRLWLRCGRRRMHAQLLRRFFHDFSIQQLDYIMYTFRYRVMKAQRMVRDFIECKRGRRLALQKFWMEEEVRMQREIDRKGQRRRNAIVPQMMIQPKSARLAKLQAQSKMLIAIASKQIHQFQDSSNNHATGTGNGNTNSGSNGNASSSSSFSTPNNNNNPAVDMETLRSLCRFHLEDERRRHNKKATDIMNTLGSSQRPEINVEHVKLLLNGQILAVEFDNNKKTWPPFLLYTEGKKHMKECIEHYLGDREAMKQRVSRRMKAERRIMLENRFAAGDDTDDEEGDGGGEVMVEEGDGGGINNNGAAAAADISNNNSNNETPTSSSSSSSSSKTTTTSPHSTTTTHHQSTKKALLHKIKTENRHLAHQFGALPTEVDELREIFNLVDTDSGGTLDADELARLLDMLGMHKEDDEIRDIVDRIDTTGTGEVIFSDFVKALKGNRPNPPYTEKMIHDAFATFAKTNVVVGRHGKNCGGERNGMGKGQAAAAVTNSSSSGTIGKQQLVEALSCFPGKWEKGYVYTVLRDAGLNNPCIDYHQYVNVMFQLCKK